MLRASPFVIGAVVLGCGASVPAPDLRPHAAEHYEVVPYPPPSALVEIVPPAPRAGAVWIDGYWSWGGRVYVWERGGWVLPPSGAYVCTWSSKYEDDGTLLYAPTTWHDADGRMIDSPNFLVPAATPPDPETPEPATVP